jgi:hypothetical protein
VVYWVCFVLSLQSVVWERPPSAQRSGLRAEGVGTCPSVCLINIKIKGRSSGIKLATYRPFIGASPQAECSGKDGGRQHLNNMRTIVVPKT